MAENRLAGHTSFEPPCAYATIQPMHGAPASKWAAQFSAGVVSPEGRKQMNEYQPRNQGFNRPQGWPPQPSGARGSFGAETAAVAGVAERMAFVRKVYALFFAATLFAIAGVGVGFVFPPVMYAVVAHPWLSFFVLIGGVMGAQAVRLVPGVNLLA